MSTTTQPTTTQHLSQQIQNAVVHHPHLNHRKVYFKSEMGRVTIEGTVQSYFEKQMAQEALRKIDGIVSIENHLEVTWSN